MYLLAEHQWQCQRSLSPSGKWTFTWVFFKIFFYRESLWLWQFLLGRPLAISICSIFPLCMESNTLENSTNKSVASRFFTQTLSKIQRNVRICDVVDWFLWKSFWFFQRIFSISGSMWSSINFSHNGGKGYISVVLGNSKVTFLGKKEDAAFCPSVYCVMVIQGVAVFEAVCHWISLSSILLVVFHQDRQLFCF